MKTRLSKLLAIGSLFAGSAIADAAYTTPASFTGSYAPNFDTMGTTAPTGWDILSLAGSHDTFAFVNSSGSALATPVFPWGTPTSIVSGPTGTNVLDHRQPNLTYEYFSTTNTGVRSGTTRLQLQLQRQPVRDQPTCLGNRPHRRYGYGTATWADQQHGWRFECLQYLIRDRYVHLDEQQQRLHHFPMGEL